VAAQTGFADQSHFSRLFRRTYGLSPAAWASVARAGESSWRSAISLGSSVTENRLRTTVQDAFAGDR
jgi:AraC-like DNA-binding protein